MNDYLGTETTRQDLAPTPVMVEIRVRGLLEGERWQRWFEGMAMEVNEATRETILYGPVADQAALYGLLARTRDLALPLLSVQVGGRRRGRWLARAAQLAWQWLLGVLAYLLVAGAMSALTVYLTSQGMETSLALGMLFVVLGGLAFGLSRSRDGRGWAILGALELAGAAIALTLYVIGEGWVSLPLMLALMGFVLGGGLLAALLRPRPRIAPPAEDPPAEWEPLGTPHADATPDE